MPTIFKRVPRTVGFGAGLLALVLIVYSLAGALWGFWRPELHGTQVEEGGYSIDNVADVQFSSYITFALITGVLSLILGLGVYSHANHYRGLRTLLWIGVCALAGAFAFYIAGGITATGLPNEAAENISFVPPFNPGVTWAVGPFIAMFAYWSAIFVGGEEQYAESEHSAYVGKDSAVSADADTAKRD
ncbi:hypothetical protein VVR26_01940 [Corynebacterium camporealensis]|uniref:hypothetical protein n=1 Tax=Corynebacterium camporealensis TaxID=161896 RepID=UPI0034CDD73C